MRLFGKVNNLIDRFDRAEWITWLFDLAFGTGVVSGPYCVDEAEVFSTGGAVTEIFSAGRAAGEVFAAGAAVGEIDGRAD